jgi:ABC-type multidrug transport system fused ATPase/permease subunit
MKDAELVESGSHEALLACDGLYASLYRIQTSREPDRTPA